MAAIPISKRQKKNSLNATFEQLSQFLTRSEEAEKAKGRRKTLVEPRWSEETKVMPRMPRSSLGHKFKWIDPDFAPS